MTARTFSKSMPPSIFVSGGCRVGRKRSLSFGETSTEKTPFLSPDSSWHLGGGRCEMSARERAACNSLIRCMMRGASCPNVLRSVFSCESVFLVLLFGNESSMLRKSRKCLTRRVSILFSERLSIDLFRNSERCFLAGNNASQALDVASRFVGNVAYSKAHGETAVRARRVVEGHV